jgi:transcriptional regulator with XRE-family HTH domain
MLSETLEHEIEQYRIGRKLRWLRVKKSMSLADLAAHTGLSTGLISKLETGKMTPTLPTLTRIALVFGVGLDHFFASKDSATFELVRKADRIRLPAKAGERHPAFRFESLDYPAKNRRMSAYLAIFGEDARAAALTHRHEGFELVFVLKGELRILHDDVVYELGAGDSAYFDGRVDHSYESRAGKPCEAVVVVTQSAV